MTRLSRLCTLGLALSALAALASCAGPPASDAAEVGERPTYGGTLKLVGSSDVDHFTTTSAYINYSLMLLGATSRQLVGHPPITDFDSQTVIVPDVATAVPTRENGGISADGRTYTFHLRQGVRWNTSPARQVSAADEVRGIQMLCNPVSPTGAPGYYESTITGFKEFCDAFARVPGTVADIRTFVATHPLAGVEARDDSTAVFHLLQPTSDFLELVALPFASPVPAEELNYLSDGPDFRAHMTSDGPYQVVGYIRNRSILLTRNPAWDPAADPIRKAYPDTIQITEGVDAESSQQQLEAGMADMDWATYPSSVDLASLVPLKDPGLVIGPAGDNYTTSAYLAVNFLGDNERGALRKLAVRRAIEYAVDRVAVTQVFGGPIISRPLTQAVVKGSGGYRVGYDPYPSPNDHGDPAKARQLLASAGYPNGVTLKLLYQSSGNGPRVAQSIQASMARAGIRLTLIPATTSDFYAKYLSFPDNARRGVWDLAAALWGPDWYGSANGRTVIEALFDGRLFGPNTNDYGDYNSAAVDSAIDAALSANSASIAEHEWEVAATDIIQDGGVIPLVQNKYPLYHSARLRNCVYELRGSNCELTAVWLHGAPGARPQLATRPNLVP